MPSIPRIRFLDHTSDLVGEQVFVYRNLHRDCWSLRSKRTGRVVAHVDYLRLADARFLVSEAGRQRVLQEKKKNVHAGIEGTVAPFVATSGNPHRRIMREMDTVTYNPYLKETFYLKDKYPFPSIHRSPEVAFSGKNVFAK